eukprot:Skav225439  [mRNA]  locus=scaffold1668:59077:59475:- [translate_table: standard]
MEADEAAEKRKAWDSVVAPMLNGWLEESTWILGERFSAGDVLLGLTFFGVHNKMATRGSGSWVDGRFPALLRYISQLAERPAYRLAFSGRDSEAWKEYMDQGLDWLPKGQVVWDEARPWSEESQSCASEGHM